MFNIFGPKTFSPLSIFSEVESYTNKVDGKQFRVRGVLYPKSIKKGRASYLLKMTEKDAQKDGVDSRRVSLQVLAYREEVELIDKWLGWEVVLEGRLSVKVWIDTGSVKVSLKNPKVIKGVQVVEIDNDAELEEVMTLFEQNPRNKPRGEQVIDYICNVVKQRKINVLLLGPRGKGVDDICAEFERARGLGQYVNLTRQYRTLSPSSLMADQIKEHFLKLCEEISGYSESGQYDLICIARGGGDPIQLSSLNNKDLCEGIINCSIPVCASVAHATDDLWLKRCSDLFTNVPAVFVGELKRAVDKVYPGAVEFVATQQEEIESEESAISKESILIWIILGAVIIAMLVFICRLLI